MRLLGIAMLTWALATLHAGVAVGCAGDCGIDGEVTVDELIAGVGIALGSARVDRCPAADGDGDQAVTIAELVAAVNAALSGCPASPRLIALSREGRIASLDVASPWTVRKTADLGATIASARCRAGRCLIVHPAPIDAISIVAADDLARGESIVLDHGADPRDVAFVDDDTAVVTQYERAALLVIDLRTRVQSAVDLTPLADDDGLAEPLRMASCGSRVFVQLRRFDHGSGTPSALDAALAVVDFSLPEGARLVDADPVTRGVQGIALAERPNFDMPVDCAGQRLYVAEPIPLMQGGGGYEQVDLATLQASALPIATGAEVGGFEIVRPDAYWLITHTEFGPGPSSHLTFFGETMGDTYNTFADEHINDLALDRVENLLFFPDACTKKPSNQSCDRGIHVFAADSGTPLLDHGIDVGFPPIEATIAR